MLRAARVALAVLLGPGMAAAATVPPTTLDIDPYRRADITAPLELTARHSVDFQDMDGILSDAEMDLTIQLWRDGQYHPDQASPFGYTGGAGTPAGIPHSADILSPLWTIDDQELSRQLASWRAGQYRANTNAWDGFVPDWRLPYAVSTGAFSAVLYVDAAATNPLPPYASSATAAATIQDAVHAAPPGAVIRVASGIYCAGAVTSPHGPARLVITNAVTVESLGGPGAVMIMGAESPPTRCVIMDHPEAALRGVTLTQGYSGGTGNTLQVKSGGALLGLRFREISDCDVRDSSALPWGSGGGMALIAAAGLVTRTTVSDNQAAYGGGVAIYWGAQVRLRNCRIVRNHATVHAGGLLADNCPNLINLLMHDNSAALTAGGAWLGLGSELWHATVTRNTAPSAGGALFAANGGRIGNSILYYNNGGNIARQGGASGLSVLSSCSSAIPDPAIAATNLITTPPQFVNPMVDDFRIRGETSPLLDAGLVRSWTAQLTDLDGAPRLQGSAPDLGAYERSRIHLTVTPPAGTVPAGSIFPLSLEAEWPEGAVLGALSLSFQLPPGWTLHSVTGEALPEIHGSNILFLGRTTNTRVTAVAGISTDFISRTNQAIHAGMTWQLSGLTEALVSSQDTVTVTAILPDGFLVAAFADEGGDVSPAMQMVSPGSNATLLVTADPYQVIEQIVVGTDPLPGGAGLTRFDVVITNLQSDLNVYAYFTEATTIQGVPLAWLAGYGLTNQPPDLEAGGDPDGDHATTWEEYLAGTSPIDAASLFVLEQGVFTPREDKVSLTWPSVSGRIYQVEFSTTLDPPTWTLVATNLAATPPYNSRLVPAAVPGEGFYRILTGPQP